TDGNAVHQIEASFALDYRFSASQLESYIGCPFQFFSKYVLNLEPSIQRDELDEDHTDRGTRIHKLLQKFEESRHQTSDASRYDELARTAVELVLQEAPVSGSEIEPGLREIDRRLLMQVIRRYVTQLHDYELDPTARPNPFGFEVEFG